MSPVGLFVMAKWRPVSSPISFFTLGEGCPVPRTAAASRGSPGGTVRRRATPTSTTSMAWSGGRRARARTTSRRDAGDLHALLSRPDTTGASGCNGEMVSVGGGMLPMVPMTLRGHRFNSYLFFTPCSVEESHQKPSWPLVTASVFQCCRVPYKCLSV